MSKLIQFTVMYIMWHMPGLVLSNVSQAVLSAKVLNNGFVFSHKCFLVIGIHTQVTI